MLKPKKIKFEKQQRGRLKGNVSTANNLIFGNYALQAQEACWLLEKQLEATRRVIIRTLKREGKVWIRVFPQKSISKRISESRMGSGKGTIAYWVAVIKPGVILIEISTISEIIAKQALIAAAYKLPIKTKIIKK